MAPQLRCIRRSAIGAISAGLWAGDWTDEQVAAGRARDRAAKAVQFGNTPTPLEVKGVDSEPPKTRGAIARLWRWMTRR